MLWRDPVVVDIVQPRGFGRTGAQPPRPPFRFSKEDFTGSSPKLLIRDASSVEWRVKGGYETKSEPFATRFVSALGYYAESMWFVPSGSIRGVMLLKRAGPFVGPDGGFVNAAFERRDPHLKLLSQDWAWNDNPFQHTHELHGLKIVMMLLSNWDNKDVRNRLIGSNTGIVAHRDGNRVQLIYFINDWGQTLGAWGSDLRSKAWDCAAFTAQTRQFVQGRDGDKLRFGFVGLHTREFKSDITTEDVRWLLQYLGRVTDSQIRRALKESGATEGESECFVAALRDRIDQLRQAAAAAPHFTRHRRRERP